MESSPDTAATDNAEIKLPKNSKENRYYYRHREDILEKKRLKKMEDPEYRAKYEERQKKKAEREELERKRAETRELRKNKIEEVMKKNQINQIKKQLKKERISEILGTNSLVSSGVN